MASLEEVEQAFRADMTAFLGGLDAGIAKADDFARACKDAADSVAEITLAAEEMAREVDAAFASAMGSARALDGQMSDLGRAAATTGAGFGAANDAVSSMTRRLGTLDGRIGTTLGALVALDVELDRKAKAFGSNAAMVAALAAGLGALNAGITANTARTAANAATTTAATGVMIRGWRLTGAALHWIVMGTLEIASTAIPAMVALGAAAAGMAPTFIHLSDQVSNLIVASGSMKGALLNSVGPLHQLGLNFGTVSAAMAPDAYIIFGSLIQDLTSRFGVFSGVAQQAGGVLAAFATKITMDLQGPAGAAMAGFFSNAVKYMIQWGQVLGNLGHAFLNAVNAMWGVGQILLDVLVALSRAFLALTSNPVGAWLIGVAAAMSAVYRYGQLMVTIFRLIGGTAVVTAIRGVIATFVALNATMAASDAAVLTFYGVLASVTDFMMGPVGIAIGVITAGLGIWYLATRSTGDATAHLIRQVQSMPPTVTNLTSGIGKLQGEMNQLGKTAATASYGPTRLGVSARQLAVQDIPALTKAIRQQELELLNLDIGLAQAGAGTGAVAAGENALAVSTAIADSKVQQLNQALDAYMQLVTGGTGSLAAFTNSLANIGSVAGRVRNNLGASTVQMSLNAHQFAAALSHMNTTGASAWTNLDQVLGSTMPQFMDWFRQAGVVGAATGATVSKAALDMTAEIMKYAGSNKTAQAQVLAFARAQGISVSSWAALKTAVKDQGAGQADLARKVDATTVALSNLTQMARNTSAALNSQVSNSLATAALKASGFQADVNNAAAALASNVPGAAGKAAYWLGLADQAQIAAGNNAVTMAQKMSGASSSAVGSMSKVAGEAQTAAGQVHNLAIAIDGLQSKTVFINVVQQGGGGQIHIPGAQGMAAGGTAQRGVALVGEKGPELMFMRGGEEVIPHDVTRALLSMAGHLPKVTGYAGGTGFFDKIMDEVARDFRVILDRILGISPHRDPQYAAILRLENEVRREFREHKISRREELRLLHRLESIDDRLELIAARHHAQQALSRDISGLLGEFAPKPRGPVVAPAIQALLNLVKKDQAQGLIGDRKADWLTAWLDHENRRLEKLLGERARLAARMKAVQAYETSVAQAAQQQASLAGVISGLGGGPQSSATLLAGMQQQLAQIRRFDADIRRLSKLGLDRALINQIIQMGPAQGSQVAEALINGPLANIAALNKTETQVQQASKALGNTAATAVYGSGKDFGKNFLAGLRSQEKAIEAEMAKIARDMVDVLEDALGLHGKHRRRHHHHPHHAGAAFMAAVAAGMTDSTGAGSAARAAAGYVPSALGSAAAGISGGSVTTVPIYIPVTVALNGRELYKTVQERSLRIDRRNGRNNLSLSAGRRR